MGRKIVDNKSRVNTKMISIELSEEKIFRNQSFKGSLHISSFSPYFAQEINAYIIMKEKYKDNWGRICVDNSIKKVLFERKNVEISPAGHHVPFEYTIPEDAPYTFNQYPIGFNWGIQVSIKKTRFSQEKKWKRIIVLPHVLKSESHPSLDKVPMSLHEEIFPDMKADFRRLWHQFTKSTAFEIQTDRKEYFPGDLITGRIHFHKQFRNETLKICLVFIRGGFYPRKEFLKRSTFPKNKVGKKKFVKLMEKEELISSKKATFPSGSAYPFSIQLSPLTFPDIETEHSGIHWKVRATMVKPFYIGRFTECRLKILPLVF